MNASKKCVPLLKEALSEVKCHKKSSTRTKKPPAVKYSDRAIYLTLENIMEIPATEELFKEHLRHEFSVENYLFWQEADIQRWVNDQIAVSHGRSFMNLTESFVNQVNIPDKPKKTDSGLDDSELWGISNVTPPQRERGFEQRGPQSPASEHASVGTQNSDRTAIPNTPSYDEILLHAREIFQTYIHKDAMLQINISGELVKVLDKRVSETHKTSAELADPSCRVKPKPKPMKRAKTLFRKVSSKTQVAPVGAEFVGQGSNGAESISSWKSELCEHGLTAAEISRIQSDLKTQLIFVFQEARDEVWKIMERDSFERFKSTRNFQRALEIFTSPALNDHDDGSETP